MTKSKTDIGLEVLLDLHGTEYTEENGYWYKIEAWRVIPSKEVPHGIRYNLTLHNNYNKRILGFDNAHAVKSPTRAKFKGRVITYDHKHRSSTDTGIPYAFSSAQQLLSDFFNEVNRIVKGDEK
ncbi:hypothetical protein ACSV5M_14420 [Cellvibrio sp. ARAG 10.3]|uniref:hypothetical protein n=1 Tax=Cellvibrio sp. ARAG 10.3 TaxID=3451358 RepID=UPI003F4693AB